MRDGLSIVAFLVAAATAGIGIWLDQYLTALLLFCMAVLLVEHLISSKETCVPIEGSRDMGRKAYSKIAEGLNEALAVARATTPFNAAYYLKSPEMMQTFLDEAYVSGDRAVVAAALGSIIEAVRRDEREACAKIVDGFVFYGPTFDARTAAQRLQELIRARSNSSK